jgi:hypothetical protein
VAFAQDLFGETGRGFRPRLHEGRRREASRHDVQHLLRNAGLLLTTGLNLPVALDLRAGPGVIGWLEGWGYGLVRR